MSFSLHNKLQLLCCTLFVLCVDAGMCVCLDAVHTCLRTVGIFLSITHIYCGECRKYGAFLLRHVLSLHVCLDFHVWCVFFHL